MERCQAQWQRWNRTVLLHRLGNTNIRQGCVWTEADRDRWTDRYKKERNTWCKRQIQETSRQMQCGTPLYVEQRVYMWERLMDGLVHTARGVHGEGEREIWILQGWHGLDDVIDLTRPMSPRRETDSDRWIETEMRQRKGRPDRQIDQDRGMQRGDKWIERGDKER